jgi:oligopeptidase B
MPVEPPVAEVLQHREERHGREFVDPYHWLRDTARQDPRVLAYLKAENDYTEAVMKPNEPLVQSLFEEFVGRIKETDSSVPARRDDFYYYSRTEKGRQYRIYCRKRGSPEADEELLVDANKLAEGHEYFRLGVFSISPDHDLLAYFVDTGATETYTVHVKDLRSGELLEERIPNTYGSLEWASDNRTFFYNTVDAAHRPHRLYRHLLGGDPARDELVYEEPDESFFLGLHKTRSRKYLILSLESHTTSEIRFLDADRPGGDFRLVHPRQREMEYFVGHWRDRFYIRTNDDAVNFKLVEAPVSDPARSNWREVIPHRPEVKLESVDFFARHMAIVERESGTLGVRIVELPGWQQHKIALPESVYTVETGLNLEFDTERLRFNYESLVTPPSVFDYDMTTGECELKKEEEVLGGYDKRAYRSERLFARAPDGKSVPISVVYREGMKRDGRNPLLLYGYGSYGSSVDPTFSSTRVSLLDRGFVFAIAHVRGGGDMGRPWYDDGKLMHKRNTFADFIACAETLIAEDYTSSECLAILGGSAGGLLMGAVVNMRPELFSVVVAKVPFVDVVNTMLDPSLPLTVIEWEEWGDPRHREDHDYMMSYSPYDNVEAQAYPHMLVTSGLNDPRVAYWEPTKWVARLRATKTDHNLLLLRTNLDAGHAGASGRYDSLKEQAIEFAFVLDRLGVT